MKNIEYKRFCQFIKNVHHVFTMFTCEHLCNRFGLVTFIVWIEDDRTLGGYVRVFKGGSVSTVRANFSEVYNGMSMVRVCLEIYLSYFIVQ